MNERKADLTIRSLTVAAYTMRREGWFNLKIAGQLASLDNQFRIGVLKSEPLLRGILDKAITTITPWELNQIANRHAPIRIESGTDYRLVVQIVVVFSVMLLTSLYWIGRLRRLNEQLQIKSQTDALTGLANRAELDRRFARALEQARRYNRPLSIVMLISITSRASTTSSVIRLGTAFSRNSPTCWYLVCAAVTPWAAGVARSSCCCVRKPMVSRRWRSPSAFVNSRGHPCSAPAAARPSAPGLPS